MRPGLSIGIVALALATSSARARDVPAPSNTTVETSRGEQALLVHAPVAVGGGDAPKPLVLLVSGEGGWRSFDALLARFLTEDGFWVGGVDAMHYFWKAQDDRQALAADMRAYAAALARAAGRDSGAPLLLMGYSFGADIAPWVAGAGGWEGRIHGLVMIGPDETGSLEFRVSELLGMQPSGHTFPVAQALRSAAGIPTLLVHGAQDADSAAPALIEVAAEPRRLSVIPGAGHHFGGHSEELHSALRDGLAWLLATPHPSTDREGRN